MNHKSLIIIIIAVLFHSLPISVLADVHGKIQITIQEIFAKYKKDKGISYGLGKLLSSKGHLSMSAKDNLKVLQMVRDSKSMAWFLSTNDVISLNNSSISALLKILIKNPKAIRKLRKVTTDGSFKGLYPSLKASVLRAMANNANDLERFPDEFHHLRKLTCLYSKLKRKFGAKVTYAIYKIACAYPKAARDIESYVQSDNFSNTYYTHHGRKITTPSKVQIKAMFLQAIGAMSTYCSTLSGDAKTLVRNTLNAIVKGPSAKISFQMRNYGDDGQAEGKAIVIKANASRFWISHRKVSKVAAMVNTIVHEVNHCTRNVNMTNANINTMMDEYIAWYVGRFAQKGSRPSGKDMYKIYEDSLKSYPHVANAKNTRFHSHYTKFVNFLEGMKNSSGNAPFDTNRYDELNTFKMTYKPHWTESYASRSNTSSPAVASASPADTGMGLLGQATGEVTSPAKSENTPDVDLAGTSEEGALAELTNLGGNKEGTGDDDSEGNGDMVEVSFETDEDAGDEGAKEGMESYHG